MSPLTPEQQEEIAKEMVANRARQEALSEDRKEGMAEVKISLVRPSGDPPLFSSESQAEIQSVRSALRDEGIEADTPFMVMDSPDCGGGYTGEFIIQVAHIVLPPVAVIIGAWLHGRFGREVRVEFYVDGKPKRIDAPTTAEVNLVLETARREAQPRPAKKATK
jgi:hypothetical protein